MNMKNLIFFGGFLFSFFAVAQEKLTNDLIWNSRTFNAESFSQGPSMKDGLHYTLKKHNDLIGDYIVKYAYQTGDSVGTVASSLSIFQDARKSFDGYQFSADEKQLLVETNTQPLYRYSYYSDCFIHHLEKKTTQPLDATGSQRLATYSPDGKKIAYVLNNNLYYFNLESQQKTAITQDGKWNEVIYGATDWVYEEEFALVQGFAWSPNSQNIAYLRFDEKEVPEYGMDLYGSLYPERVSFKYPKAGEKNSNVELYHYHLNSQKNNLIRMAGTADQYIPRIAWNSSDESLFAYKLNRLQNQLEIWKIISAPTGIQEKVIFTEKSDTYIDITDNLIFLNHNEGFVMTSEQNGFQHIYHFDNEGRLKGQVTKGEWEVTQVYGIDDKNNIYFAATENAIGQGIYRIQLNGKNMEPWMGQKYAGGYNQASFSTGMKYFILTHSNADQPSEITLHNQKAEVIRALVKNENLKSKLKNYGCVKKEFFQFQTTNGTKLNGWMMMPAEAKTSGKQYPVLVAIYGGPGRNTVVDQFEGKTYLWHQLLVQNGYIVVSVDPRGTQFRGKAFKHSTYLQLGKLETQDFISTAQFLQGLPFVKKDRINMQGWSFGGYMTSLCMTKGADVYHAGIAVAPVTNWKYYDSVYTERFLRTPAENKSGYEENSPVNFSQQLKGPFLLIHGSADDNVHYQNSMDFAEALIQANKPFDFFSYPNKNHGIYGGKTRLHLFEKMTNFLLENK
jgi:dipeptidyl-peptidase 4